MSKCSGFLGAIFILLIAGCSVDQEEQPAILIFSKTEGYRHQSIEHGAEIIKKLAEDSGYKAVYTEAADVFTEDSLNQFKAVVFLNTTGDILNPSQQANFQRFIQAGGGYIGIHAAADTEFKWPWYGNLVGGYFNGHPNDPNVRQAIVRNVADHTLMDSIPEEWSRNDEWYDYKDINPAINVLQNLDETTYEGGKMGEHHPITWYHEFDGGRAFYTGMGHTKETYDEPLYQKLLKNALQYVVRDGPLDYQKVTYQKVPDEDRFTKVVLDFNLDEPTELDFLPDGRIIFIERKGNVKLYLPEKDTTLIINNIDVFHEEEDGLMGLAVDPNFKDNYWVYLFYSPAGDSAVNRLSRFEFLNNSLLMSSETVILDVPVQREECCHTGGSIAFDAYGNLYLSTGDNTNPFASEGYAPIDERNGRDAWDAQRSSANTNDLRGKILRIKPQPNGTYTIPEGNLFPEGTAKTKAEIYVMGMRNPYRISVDQKTGYLYWGDVGPDARATDSLRGPRGYDEINQTRSAGFHGWPYFVGDNYVYNDYNFGTKTSGETFDPDSPRNESPNNTGLKDLPPAKPAYIWYPYASSPEFPIVKDGGRNAMAGPVYHPELYSSNKGKYPAYFENKLFIYDWMRNWILVVTMNEKGDLESLEPFVPNIKFNNLMDMEFSPTGELYVLEYGSGWFQHNIDARLVRIEYNSGNRQPVLALKDEELVGQVPLQVSLSANDSYDPDKDQLNYTWFLGKEKIAEGSHLDYVIDEAGIFLLTLKADDGKGGVAYRDIIARAGNAAPEINIKVSGNSTFFWDGREIEYDVSVKDKEDGSTTAGTIPSSAVQVFHDFLERGYDMTEIAEGHQRPTTIALGQQLMADSDCKACHKVEGKSIGPSYIQVAERYTGREGIITYLGNKIINGGSGAWGEVAMSAHPGFTPTEAGQIAEYIMSLGDDEKVMTYPLQGIMRANKHDKDAKEGMYMITATYKDRGNKIGSIQVTEQLTLRHPRLQAENYNKANEVSEYGLPDGNTVIIAKNGSWLKYEDVDLSDVKQIVVHAGFRTADMPGGIVEIRKGAVDGQIIGEVQMKSAEGLKATPVIIDSEDGKDDVFIVFKNPDIENMEYIGVDWIEFQFDKSQPLP
ncbi:MAG: ThuA domain-containing protein [Candidatus Cyclobacteriaceae bacterium M2_1C_046]